MAMWVFSPILLTAGSLLWAGEVIDRIAVVVGDQIITKSDVIRELRTVALLNGKPLDLSPEAKQQAADRLVEQSLVRREMQVSRYTPPSAVETEKLLEQTVAERFSTEAAYQQALAAYGLTEEELRQHLQLQLMTLRFIDFRFRPGIQVPLDDVRDYFEQKFLPERRSRNSEAIPSFEETRYDIEQILTEQLVDQALDRWMNQQRTQTRIRYHQEALR